MVKKKATKPRFITKKRFLEWVRTAPATTSIRRVSATSCPLARASGYHVGVYQWSTSRGATTYPLPKWATDFVQWFDRRQSSSPRTVAKLREAMKFHGPWNINN